MPERPRHGLAWARAAVPILVILALWWIAGAFQVVNPIFLPSLPALAGALGRLFSGSEIYLHMLATTYRALVGLALSAAVAVPLGLVFGRIPRLYEFVEFPVDFCRSVPSSSLFFLFILFFGIGDASKVAVVFYGCSLVLLVNTIYGARPSREKQDRINMLRSFGATRWQVFHMAVFLDALPHIMAGLRVSVSLAFVLVIVTEMFLGASTGMGRAIYDNYLAYRIPDMYATILILGILGLLANRVCVLIERRMAFWSPTQL